MKNGYQDSGFQDKKLKIIVVSNDAEALCTLQAEANFYFANCLSGRCSKPIGEQVQTFVKGIREKKGILSDQ